MPECRSAETVEEAGARKTTAAVSLTTTTATCLEQNLRSSKLSCPKFSYVIVFVAFVRLESDRSGYTELFTY